MNYTNIPAHEIRIIFQLWQSKHFSEWHFTLSFPFTSCATVLLQGITQRKLWIVFHIYKQNSQKQNFSCDFLDICVLVCLFGPVFVAEVQTCIFISWG